MNVVLHDSQHHNLVFVGYYFERPPEHWIKLKTHGNAKDGSMPYLRTYTEEHSDKDEGCCKQK